LLSEVLRKQIFTSPPSLALTILLHILTCILTLYSPAWSIIDIHTIISSCLLYKYVEKNEQV